MQTPYRRHRQNDDQQVNAQAKDRMCFEQTTSLKAGPRLFLIPRHRSWLTLHNPQEEKYRTTCRACSHDRFNASTHPQGREQAKVEKADRELDGGYGEGVQNPGCEEDLRNHRFRIVHIFGRLSTYFHSVELIRCALELQTSSMM